MTKGTLIPYLEGRGEEKTKQRKISNKKKEISASSKRNQRGASNIDRSFEKVLQKRYMDQNRGEGGRKNKKEKNINKKARIKVIICQDSGRT
jgi:hypothetical protein